jgi:hypothetical protein
MTAGGKTNMPTFSGFVTGASLAGVGNGPGANLHGAATGDSGDDVTYGLNTVIIGALSVGEQSAPAVSSGTSGKIYFDDTANKFKVSEAGGAYVDLVGGSGHSVSDVTAQIDGITDTFTVPNYTTGSVIAMRNGVMEKPSDLTENNPTNTTIQLSVVPVVTEDLYILYIPA